MPPVQREIRSDFELRQDDDGFRVTLAAPGLRTEDLELSIADHMLSFKGETKTTTRHVTLDRSLRLPAKADSESEEVEVHHADGLIVVFLPNLPEPGHRELKMAAPAPPPAVTVPKDEGAGATWTDDQGGGQGFSYSFPAPGVKTDDLSVDFDGGSKPLV